MSEQEPTTGRELDVLIAEKVMGQTDLAHLQGCYEESTLPDGDGYEGFFCPRCKRSASDTGPCAPSYSSNIAAAFQVVERMNELRYSVSIYSQGSWRVEFEDRTDNLTEYRAFGDTLPLAICRAALESFRQIGEDA